MQQLPNHQALKRPVHLRPLPTLRQCPRTVLTDDGQEVATVDGDRNFAEHLLADLAVGEAKLPAHIAALTSKGQNNKLRRLKD
jgi:hypothetical protein